ncbi:hypothetical protein [Nocardia pseudobrasiliensis]|uniref:Excreted virulence factor EspC (Type VII ESX diderm) n=1 Tax=Nocardia pseudobrasiliensis TaxID=45979 RepID=A0A370ID50_9NOCA|nr:hypothetical protein [Nocardia pseudobrasiliensis]RDI68647.1 hypothetical protein DFR76_101182 [Nocardia pseudobrasiliensis]
MQSQQDGDLRSDVAALTQAVDDGELWIDRVLVADGTHERCARRYELLADQVEQQLGVLRAAGTLPGFGGFESGNSLRRGFEGKAADALQRLQEYADAARQLAQTLRAAGSAYAQHDADVAAAIGRVGVGHA